MKRILIIGATGMAGHIMTLYLESLGKYEVLNSVYRKKLNDNSIVLDLNNRDDVFKLLKNCSPDIIVNCVGVLVGGSILDSANAIYLNSYLPHFLSTIAAKNAVRLIHISTDCVFSGSKGNYKETDFRDADDVYGRSKALGEVINEKDLTIRTSIVGPELKKNGEGLFHWFMNEKGMVKGYSSAVWGGVTTLELAKFVDCAISKNYTGLVHLSNGEGISKYELLNLFKTIWNKDVEIKKDSKFKIDKSIAKSIRISYRVPSYKRMLLDQYSWMNKNKTLYDHYDLK